MCCGWQELEAAKTKVEEDVKNSGLAMLKVVKGYRGSSMSCKVADIETCNEKEKKFIDTMKAKTKEDWEKQVARVHIYVLSTRRRPRSPGGRNR